MPRYYFDLDDLGSSKLIASSVDDVGTEFADMEEARQAALRFLPAYARDEFGAEIVEQRTLDLRVRDESGQVFYRVRLVLNGQWEAVCDGR